MDDKKLFLLDAYALIYRAYYALIRAPRITSKGFNTSAIFGFCNTLDEILRKENPTHIAVCFDPKGGHTFRHEVYPEYKAGRDAQPEDITLSIPYIKRIIEAYNIPIVEMERYEADDIIGTLARRAESEGFTTYMMTPDKDYGQLVTDHTFMYRPSLGGKGFEIRGVKEVCEKYGIDSTSQVIDLLALEGDASDNIPGCPGVGEKTAVKLIKEWGSVENMLENASSIKGALGRKVAENAEQIKFSKYLATIKTDVPVKIDIESLIRKPENVEELRQVYTELEFKTFISRLGSSDTTTVKAADPQPVTGSLFDFEESPADTTDEEIVYNDPLSSLKITIADDAASVAPVINRAVESGTAAIEIYSIGDQTMTARFEGLSIAFDSNEAYYIPMPADKQKREELCSVLQPLFISPSTTISSNDVKRDMILLKRENITFEAPYFDTSVAHYLIQPEMKHSLRLIARSILPGFNDDNWSAAKPYTAIGGNIDEIALETGRRAATVLLITPLLRDKIEKEGLSKLLTDIESPFVKVLASMEWEGARIDVGELHQLSGQLTERLHQLEEEVYRLAGQRFNISSPAQVGQILFETLKIDGSGKKTKKGSYSTSEEILEKLRHTHPIVDIILKTRALKKLLTTYVNALPELVNKTTGRIHTTFNQTVTATGRISSTNPNLQNIPIRTEDGREIRRAFIAAPGNLLMSADYSQIELRLLADMSNDPDMVSAFLSGRDFHTSTAARIFGIPVEEVTDDQRRKAKTANFGIVYGISAFGLSERLTIPRAEAKQLIDGYYASFPGIRQYINDAIEKARQRGFVETVMRRRRYLPDINSRNSVVRGYAERNAVNAPLQGSAADIIKRAMIDIYNAMDSRGMKSKMIIQVHDELIFDVVPEELDELQQLVVELMRNAFSGAVPLEVSAGVGKNWLEAH
ncbi:MAG: DNA polymerase I [Muribaculaceae bacterium]|nr:DNA polymerase I [Muribaculaceae bacterium]